MGPAVTDEECYSPHAVRIYIFIFSHTLLKSGTLALFHPEGRMELIFKELFIFKGLFIFLRKTFFDFILSLGK